MPIFDKERPDKRRNMNSSKEGNPKQQIPFVEQIDKSEKEAKIYYESRKKDKE